MKAGTNVDKKDKLFEDSPETTAKLHVHDHNALERCKLPGLCVGCLLNKFLEKSSNVMHLENEDCARCPT